MKKILAGILACCLVTTLAACSNTDSPKKDDVNTAANVTTDLPNNDTDVSESEPERKTLVGIPGSNALDIRLGLEQSGGIPKGEVKDAAEISSNSKFCASSMEVPGVGVNLAYNLSLDEDEAITTAVFSITSYQVSSNEDILDFAKSFFSFCASMPYDTADVSSVQEWVSQNVSDYANSPQTTIGDAKFSIAGIVNDDSGRLIDLTLTIKPANFDEQMQSIMSEKQ